MMNLLIFETYEFHCLSIIMDGKCPIVCILLVDYCRLLYLFLNCFMYADGWSDFKRHCAGMPMCLKEWLD
jgi:hypothetical protein